MKIYPHLFAKLFAQPLMLTEPVRRSLEGSLLAHMGVMAPQDRSSGSGIGAPGTPMEDWLEYSRDVKATREVLRLENVLRIFGSVAVVSIDGIIDKNISQMELDCYGGCDLTDIQNALSLVSADPDIERVVLAINSPGGSVTGVPETAARVAALTTSKEVHAFVDAQACSAAYYIASQADVIAAAPSATLGSIGVYVALLDETRNLEMNGYRVDLIKAGKFKAMGASFQPLTAEERGLLQTRVDALHADFKNAVKSGRRGATDAGGHQTVADSAMEGQTFNGKEALAARLCDELTVATLDEYVTALIADVR